MYMVEIMAKIQAIHNTAKRYHWQCQGKNFYQEHLFFDRIADSFTNDAIDTLAEAWYMCEDRNNLEQLNDFDKLVAQYVGKEFSKEDLNKNTVMDEMFIQLYNMISKFLEDLSNVNFTQGVNNKVDEIAQSSTQILGLIKARLLDNSINTVISRLARNFN